MQNIDVLRELKDVLLIGFNKPRVQVKVEVYFRHQTSSKN
jgi:ribosome maturation protein Sdo1